MRRIWLIFILVIGCSSATLTSHPGTDVPNQDIQKDVGVSVDMFDVVPDGFDAPGSRDQEIPVSDSVPEVLNITKARDVQGEKVKDYNRDSDGDGVSDGDEIDQGTDPDDPSDALQWHPEIQGYPRLFFGPEDVGKIRKSMQSWASGAASSAMQAMRRQCTGELPKYPDDYNPYVDQGRARIAKACAFVAFVDGDQAAADKAVNILKTIHTDFKGINFDSPFYEEWDIVVAEAIESYLVAYDLLAADTQDVVALQQPVHAFCDAVFDYGTKKDPKYMLTASQNNHSVKFVSAIGMCGMMFNHNRRAALYVDFAATFVDFMMNYLIDKDGGDAEGPNYNEYASVNYLPFFAAYHRLVGETREYKALNLLRLKPPAKEMVKIRDFVKDPKILANNQWLLKILIPDGRTPNIEDSNCSDMFSGMMAGIFRDPRFLANWELPTVNYNDGYMLPESLCVLGDFNTAKAYIPGPFILMPDAGQAVFRGRDKSWLMVLADHGDAVSHGGGHEQMDPTQWLYYAMGEYLVIDSGYINWKHRDLVAHPKNHNMILVDGQGPDDGPLAKVTEAFFDTGDKHSIGAHTSYKGCNIQRRYYFFDTSIAVTSLVQCDKRHKLTNLLHLNAGGDTNGKLDTKEGGVFHVTRPKAVVDGLNTCIGVCEYEKYNDFHAFTWGQKHQHTVLSVSATGTAAVFFSGLFVTAPGHSSPVFSGRTDKGLCLMKAVAQPEVLCQCQAEKCEIVVKNYKITVEKGFTRFIFDGSTMKITNSYGTKNPPIVEAIFRNAQKMACPALYGTMHNSQGIPHYVFPSSPWASIAPAKCLLKLTRSFTEEISMLKRPSLPGPGTFVNPLKMPSIH